MMICHSQAYIHDLFEMKRFLTMSFESCSQMFGPLIPQDPTRTAELGLTQSPQQPTGAPAAHTFHVEHWNMKRKRKEVKHKITKNGTVFFLI